jgi:flagellin
MSLKASLPPKRRGSEIIRAALESINLQDSINEARGLITDSCLENLNTTYTPDKALIRRIRILESFKATGTNTNPDFKFLLNGVVISGSVQADANDVGSASNIAAAINANTDKTGVIATVSKEKLGEYTLTASDGRNIVLSINAADISDASGETVTTTSWDNTGIDLQIGTTPKLTAISTKGSTNTADLDSFVVYGKLELSTDSLAGITLGGIDALDSKLGINAISEAASKSAGSGVGSVNLNTASGAQSALTTLDRAINTVTDMRASMGAYQNRLAASISNLENTSMNLSASRSRILDTDYAKETTNLAKSQIIQQAATAMLAQANQSAQSVLALLK